MLSGAVHEIRYPVEIDADYGFAVALGGAFNLPFMAGAYIALEGAYADGAEQLHQRQPGRVLFHHRGRHGRGLWLVSHG